MPPAIPAMLEPKHHALLDEAARRGLASSDGIQLCFQVLALAGAIDRDCAARLAPAAAERRAPVRAAPASIVIRAAYHGGSHPVESLCLRLPRAWSFSIVTAS